MFAKSGMFARNPPAQGLRASGRAGVKRGQVHGLRTRADAPVLAVEL